MKKGNGKSPENQMNKIRWFIGKIEEFFTDRYVEHCSVKRKVVFENFHGKGYGDSPKYIADEILRQQLGWKLIWLVNDMSVELPKGISKVKRSSFRAWREKASAAFWINNARGCRYPEKKKGQRYIQTWHGGLAFKYVEGAIEEKLDREYLELAKEDGRICDAIVSGCRLRSEEYRKYFWLNEKTEILEVGLPRNDALFDQSVLAEKYRSVRETLGIPQNHKILLYMPTFRDDNSQDGYLLNFDQIISAMERRFSDRFSVVVRMHPNVQKLGIQMAYSDRVVDATTYADAQELYMAADYMISDYSSAMFDFSLLNRPVFMYIKDCAEYRKLRGLNNVFDLCPFPRAYSVQELTDLIHNFSEVDYMKNMSAFHDIWKPFDRGVAAKQIVEWMKKKMEGDASAPS